MKEAEMNMVAEYINRVLHNPDDETTKQAVRNEVKNLCKKFPIYPNLSYV
jgi:glycine hydroxymethyltransferase